MSESDLDKDWDGRPVYYDRRGNPITFQEWARLRTDDYIRVALTRVGSRLVSTVWLGLNHNWLGGPPVIFETMVFDHNGDSEDGARYATEEAALAGHDQVVAAEREREENP